MQTVKIKTPADCYSMKVKMELMAKWRDSYIQVRHLEELLSSEPTFNLIANEWHKRIAERLLKPTFLMDVIEFVYKQEFEKAKRAQ